MSDKTIDGATYARIFAGEVEPGMVTPFGETVASVVPSWRDRVAITYEDGGMQSFSRGTTLLIREDSIREDD